MQILRGKQKRRRDEQQLQSACVQLARLKWKHGLVIYHVPNGGARSATEGAILKGMGTLKGVSDLVGAIGPRGRSFAIEMKTDEGITSPEQDAFRNDQLSVGGLYGVARSVDEFDRLLGGWIKAEREQGGKA